MTDGGDTSQAMNVTGLPTGQRTRNGSMKLRSSTGTSNEDSSLSITKEISFNDHSLVNARNGCPSSPDPLSQVSHWSGPHATKTVLSNQPTPGTYSKRRRHSAVTVNSASHSSHAKSPVQLNRKEQKVKDVYLSSVMITAAVKSLWR